MDETPSSIVFNENCWKLPYLVRNPSAEGFLLLNNIIID